MKRNKYIIIDELFPVLIHEALTHKQIGEGLKVTSAGFFRTAIKNDKIKVMCYGESVSLRIKSQPGDDCLIERFLNVGEWD